MDDILRRPYGPEVPMGCVGRRVWASSPQGWGFASDVHWMGLSNLNVFDVRLRDSMGLLMPGEATYTPSHIQFTGTRRLHAFASASFTAARDDPQNPLQKPFNPETRWTCWGSGNREDWFQVRFGAERTLRGLDLWFFDDAPSGECRPPAAFRVEAWNGRWEQVFASSSPPEKGRNEVRFDPVRTDLVRIVCHHAGERFYTGLYGFEAIGETPRNAESSLVVDGGKGITADDDLVTDLTVNNPGPDDQEFEVEFELGPQLQFPEFVSGPSSAYFQTSAPISLHGMSVVFSAGMHVQGGKVSPSGPVRKFKVRLSPGETARIVAAAAPRLESEPPSAFVGSLARPWDAKRLWGATQRWFDDNVAHFACSDPWIEKQFYHRAYLLRKNLMDPGIGRLRWPCFVEGRWRSGWYPNVISYGAGHQIREARWLRNPKYWAGHLRTFALNQKPDGVYPNFVRATAIGGGQYTDWITSTAWDGYLVHPDKALLRELCDRLAANVRGWQRTCDPDGDGLLRVDSHWWTGMEWQPSFFAFSGFRRGKQNGNEPEERVELDRVDLTSYQYGNARAVQRIYEEIERPEAAAEFGALAEKMRHAVNARMWSEPDGFYLSLRRSDGAPAQVKEVVGVYPFYFGLAPETGERERAWEALLDPEQFWTPWPVASASKQCPAYSQNGWPDGYGTACMWNGPTWPHANSIVLSAMANSLRAGRGIVGLRALSTDRLWQLFASYTRAQYRDGKIENPWTGEFYNGDTGQWKTGERDYNHSTYLDLVITILVGIVPRSDDILEIDPLVPPGKLSYFLLDGQHYRGHDVSVVWDAPGGADRFGDGRKGLDVYVDRKLRGSSPELSRMTLPLANSQ